MSETHSLGRLVRWRIPDTRTDQTFGELLAAYPFCVLDEGEHWSISGLCGRIWTLHRDYPRLDGPEDFRAWSEPGTVRVLIANWVDRDGDGSTIHSEARVAPRRPPRRAAPALAVGRDRGLRAAHRRRGARPRRRARRLAVPAPSDPAALAELLADAGFVAADEEADELLARAADDPELLDALVARRLTGEPLAWITGSVWFCGLEVAVDPGVYVPRWQSEALALRAVERLPAHGAAVDVCTGAGAIAKTLTARRPGARVVATDADERAVACARRNGVDAHRGDLLAPLAPALEGRVDVVVGVVPYVPTPDLPLLQRDTLTFESTLSYDGGQDGTGLLRRVVADSPRFLRHGGALLLELGGQQADALRDDLAGLRYVDVEVLRDEEGDVRGLEATLA